MNGTIIDISRSLSGKFRVTFEVDAIDEIRGMENNNLNISVKKQTGRRSLNANAYFHVLVGKIAEKNHISKAYCKNILLGKYGQREIQGSGQLIISIRSDVDMGEREDIHTVPIGYGTANGHDFVHYAVIRPSHLYNNLEMAALIDGTVEEAKGLGIETMTPNEIERMKSLWSQ